MITLQDDKIFILSVLYSQVFLGHKMFSYHRYLFTYKEKERRTCYCGQEHVKVYTVHQPYLIPQNSPLPFWYGSMSKGAFTLQALLNSDDNDVTDLNTQDLRCEVI